MRLKDLLITLVLIHLAIFCYGLPNLIRYLIGDAFHSFELEEIIRNLDQLLWIGFNILGMVAVVIYFTKGQNIYSRLLKIYLINHTFSLISSIPTRILWLSDSSITMETPWLYHFFSFIAAILAVVAIIVYAQQKVRTSPRAVSSKSVRFGHLAIDSVYINITLGTNLAEMFLFLRYEDSLIPIEVYTLLLIFIMPFLYYLICEAGFKQTIGKVATGAYVRSKDSQSPGFAKILGRSLCRFIPFEAFSYLIEPMAKWHDQFSGTDVFYLSSGTDVEEGDIIEHLID